MYLKIRFHFIERKNEYAEYMGLTKYPYEVHNAFGHVKM